MKRHNNSLRLADAEARMVQIAEWQDELRQAMFDGIQADDVKDIVQGIVKRAKEGDDRACRTLFEYVLAARRGQPQIHATQVNHYPPGGPTGHPPGTKGKVKMLQARASRGEDLHHGDDADRG